MKRRTMSESTFVNRLSNPVLINKLADMHAPRIASCNERRTRGSFGCSATLSNCTEQDSGPDGRGREPVLE
jgi:hypothetical protein